MRLPSLNRVFLVRVIVRGYFLGALAGSWNNLINAGVRAQLGDKAWVVPIMVDGVAVVGILMRHRSFARHTRYLGLWVLSVASSLSLAGNVYAAPTVGLAVLGAAFVGFYLAGEILSDPKHLQPAQVDADAEMARAAAELAAAAAQRKAAGIRKGQLTRARKARQRRAEAELIEGMVRGS